MKKDGIIYTVIFTFVISFLFVGLLSVVNYLTAEKTMQNRELAFQKSMLTAFRIEYNNNQEVFSRFTKEIQKSSIKSDKGDIYEFSKEEQKFYAKAFSGPGLWGTIQGILAVDENVNTIIGLDIISHNETPGLGGRIDEPWFKDQFANESLGADGRININKGGSGDNDSKNSKVDGITGASQTSDLLAVIVNRELKLLKAILKGEK